MYLGYWRYGKAETRTPSNWTKNVITVMRLSILATSQSCSASLAYWEQITTKLTEYSLIFFLVHRCSPHCFLYFDSFVLCFFCISACLIRKDRKNTIVWVLPSEDRWQHDSTREQKAKITQGNDRAKMKSITLANWFTC